MNDDRTIMTLDAGGTNFIFSALRGGQEVIEPIRLPSDADNLPKCLANLRTGFHALRSNLATMDIQPSAISFAFPGPTDYPNGIVGDLVNLPAFRGGVAVGPMLEDEFKIPVFMNNDGDLYAFGEALAGYLPWINKKLRDAGSPRQYKNLVGFTIGTGLGCGIVSNGQLFLGDNSSGAEVYQCSQRHNPGMRIEDSVNIRALRGNYARLAGISFEDAPTPEEIYKIGVDEIKGDKEAAKETFRLMGQALGDIICNLMTLIDGVAVLGGGISGAHSLFMPALLAEARGSFVDLQGTILPRYDKKIYCTENNTELEEFLRGDIKEVQVPNSNRKITYDPLARVAVGISKIGTSKAISLGAYYYALSRLQNNM